MRNAHILLFLACISPLLLGETPDAPLAADPVAPIVKSAALVRVNSGEQAGPNYRKMVIAGFMLDSAARALDAYSTHRALQPKGNEEMFLPSAIAKSQPSLYGYSASVVLSEYLGYRFLAAHHHEKIARWLPYVDSVVVLPYAIHNLVLSSQGQ